MTEFERKILDLIREAMRQRNEPMQRRIIDLEKNIHERIDAVLKVISENEEEIYQSLGKNSDMLSALLEGLKLNQNMQKYTDERIDKLEKYSKCVAFDASAAICIVEKLEDRVRLLENSKPG